MLTVYAYCSTMYAYINKQDSNMYLFNKHNGFFFTLENGDQDCDVYYSTTKGLRLFNNYTQLAPHF